MPSWRNQFNSFPIKGPTKPPSTKNHFSVVQTSKNNDVETNNRYRGFTDMVLYDTSKLYKREQPDLRVFNCSLIVKKSNGLYSYKLNNTDDKLYFMYRQTPVAEPVLNTINIVEIDPITLDMISPIKTVIKNAPRGDKEDARFFIYNGLLGISCTEKYTTGFFWLNETTLDNIGIDLNKNFPNEKNWTVLPRGGSMYLIRYYRPLEIYKYSFSTNKVDLVLKYNWDYPTLKHQIRGGASPVLKGDKYYLFMHSAKIYDTIVMTLDSDTLKPLEVTQKGIFTLPTKYQFLCGAIFNELTREWILTMGLDDLYCAIKVVKEDELESLLVKIDGNSISPSF